MGYPFKEIEEKWQREWQGQKIFDAGADPKKRYNNLNVDR